MIELRDYQQQLTRCVHESWTAGNKNILAVCATGSGKTVMMSDIIRTCNDTTVAIAHRRELVSQISVALARNGIYHNIIAPANVIRFIVSLHRDKTGKNYYNQNSKTSVAAVDTIINRPDDFRHVKYWHVDEGHHLLKSNKWGRAVSLFPNARGVGWTATPCRTDKKSLHSDQDGVYHDLIRGPSMRELINRGYLANYRVIGPSASINTRGVAISSTTGDFNSVQLREAAHNSTIVGDVVGHYIRHALGKRCVVFAVDVQGASEIAVKFNQSGVRAEVVSAKTPDSLRTGFVRKLETGELQVLVNVDLFGEGFDLPAIEVVSMARPTQSYGLYCQQFGRALRPSSGKTHGTIIDHVGNVKLHKLPDAEIEWDLYIGDVKEKQDRLTPVRYCVNPVCLLVWEGFSNKCPYCGHRPQPESRGTPEVVEGDLTEYSEELLQVLRQQAEHITASPKIPTHVAPYIRKAIENKWIARKESQERLRDAMAWWAGFRASAGDDDSERYRRFWYTFGTDVLTAQTLGAREADELATKIWGVIEKLYETLTGVTL